MRPSDLKSKKVLKTPPSAVDPLLPIIPACNVVGVGAGKCAGARGFGLVWLLALLASGVFRIV